MRKFLALTLLLGAGALAACQPVDDGAASAHIFADCDMGQIHATGAIPGHVNQACVYVNTSGATTSTPTTTTPTSVTVPVSAAGGALP